MISDYNKSVDEVYMDTASRMLESDPHPWTALSSVDHIINSSSLSSQRPSWVPRWDEGWSVYWLGYPGMWYRAEGSPSAPFHARVSKPESSLEVQSTFLDTIVWSSQGFKSKELTVAHQKKELPLQALWRELEWRDSKSVYGCSSEDIEYAFSLVIVAGRALYEERAENNPSLHQSIYQAYKDMIRRSIGREDASMANKANTQGESLEKTTEANAVTYINNRRRALHNRRVLVTSKGYYGVGHNSLEVGDVCAVLRGANVPFVLRKASPNEYHGCASHFYRLVGESYIQGIMTGEALEKLQEGSCNDGSDLTEVKIVNI